jgi:chromate transport protein ChrA
MDGADRGGGASFILPAALITGEFACAYVRFGALPQTASALAGIKAAVITVIAIAIWRLGTALKDVRLAALGGLSLATFFLNLNPIAILFGGGLVGMLASTDAPSRHSGAVLVAVAFATALCFRCRRSALDRILTFDWSRRYLLGRRCPGGDGRRSAASHCSS